MSNSLIMTVVERLQDLFEDLGSKSFGEEFILDNPIEQLTTFANLCDKTDILIIFKILIELEYIWMI